VATLRIVNDELAQAEQPEPKPSKAKPAGETDRKGATRSGWLTRLGSWLGGIYERSVKAFFAAVLDYLDKS
jgi:hypothetical protein